MKINPITSSSNPLMKRVRNLHSRSWREKLGLFLVEGPRVLNEALASGLKIEDIVVSRSFLTEGMPGCHTTNIDQVSVVEDKLFKELSTTETPAGILAVAQVRRTTLPAVLARDVSLLVLAEAVQDPGNLGTIVRTALAAGADGVILSKGTVDPYGPKVVRSAAGALFSMPVASDVLVADAAAALKDHGIKLIACDPEAGRPFWEADLSGPLALVLGNEGRGFSPEALSLADETVAIPMDARCESLNVAVAAGIMLYAAVQQRQTMRAPLMPD